MSNYTEQCQRAGCMASFDGGGKLLYCSDGCAVIALSEKVVELNAENERLSHRFFMLQHDTIEANRVHNAQMNEMSEEIKRLRKIITDEVELWGNAAEVLISTEGWRTLSTRRAEELKNALGESK